MMPCRDRVTRRTHTPEDKNPIRTRFFTHIKLSYKSNCNLSETSFEIRTVQSVFFLEIFFFELVNPSQVFISIHPFSCPAGEREAVGPDRREGKTGMDGNATGKPFGRGKREKKVSFIVRKKGVIRFSRPSITFLKIQEIGTV